MRVAFLTLAQRADFVIDDALALAELRARGWEALEVPWTAPHVDWAGFDAVVVRSTWDYHLQPERFLRTLETIDATAPRFANPLPLVQWNLDKRYLRTLEAKGVQIVPSLWGEGLAPGELDSLFSKLRCQALVLKPVISANAMDTFHLVRGASLAQAEATFEGRPWIAQPFVASLLREGEASVFFFDGAYSHGIRKVPKAGDFRVQEEHGGKISSLGAPPELLEAARGVLACLEAPPLQARVDLVRLEGGALALMELELIEPSLYFRTHPRAAANFADALERWVARTPPKR
jgi:glutathione synthase/RimK-type ligase-like ATP-grasp enzyme